MQVYLDNSATTKQYTQVTEIMVKSMQEEFGNPSSLHSLGLSAEKKVRDARKTLAKAFNSKEDEIYFTSCGTESDNTVLFGTAMSKKRVGRKIITTKVEHPAILEPAKRLEEMGFQLEYLDVNRKCQIDLKQLQSAIDDETILISIMAVNNEVGSIMPMSEIAKIKEDYNKSHGTQIWLHSDGVQAFGKIPMDVEKTMKGVDFISISGHKIHGPKGMGALYAKKGLKLVPYLIGGGQEHHFRSGTENTPGIIGFGKATELAMDNFSDRVEKMERAREFLLKGLKTELSDILINSPEDDTACPSVLNVSFLGTRGEVILHTLEQDGIFVSTGSACSSNKKGRSHVLAAMGLSEKEIEGAIRFSFSEFNTIEEMEYVLEKVKASVLRFRKLGTFR